MVENSDTQWSQSDLFLVNANTITSITAAVTVVSASGTNCPLNPAQSGAQVRIGGTFFNSGSGNPADDLTAYVIANHYGQVVDYGIWWGWQNQSQWVHISNLPMGTPVTTTIRWDQSNHRFIALLKVTNGLHIAGTSSYPAADSMPPASPIQEPERCNIRSQLHGTNDDQEVEANFDNVVINQ